MASKPTNWKSLFQDLPTSIGIHSEKDLKSIRALTDGTINDIGTENIWFRLSRETDILYLFLSTNFEIQVLHHLDILGNRHYNENKTVGLCGLSAQASAVEIDIDCDLVHIQARVPKWDKIETLSLTSNPSRHSPLNQSKMRTNESTTLSKEVSRRQTRIRHAQTHFKITPSSQSQQDYQE